MKQHNSPITGKPMKLVYEPDTIEYRGEKYDIIYLSYKDEDSGEGFTTTESDSVWWNQVTNQYREKHGIPYQDEIIALRKQYGVSATKMALILGFGTNQYRLYEEGEVPSESNGKMIRSAMNPKVFLELVKCSRHQLPEKESMKISAKVEEVIAQSEGWKEGQWEAERLFSSRRGLANGFAPTSPQRLNNLLLYVLQQMGESVLTKMNIVLFYIDFLSYRERGIAISGLTYQAGVFGPAPQRWNRVYSAFNEVEGKLHQVLGQECISIYAVGAAEMSAFSAEEMAVVDKVCDKMKGLTVKDMTKLIQEEPAWKGHAGMPETIPFSEAFSLVGM